MALIAWTVGVGENLTAGLVRRALHDHELIVIAQALAPELRPLVEWRRVRAPVAGARLRGPAFMLGATLRRAGVRADLVHAVAPLPAVAGRVDLASPNFTVSAMYEADGGRPADGLPLVWRPLRAGGRAWERWAYSPHRVRMLAALSEGQRRDLERLFPGVPVAVTPYGVDAERFRPDPGARRELRRELGLADGEMVACFAARPDRQKGLDLVLEALARLRRSHPVGVRLLVAGREADWMRPLAGRFGVADAVLFLGHRDDIERCYQAADALVVASLSEVNPQVAHEAAASGLPVVSTPVHGADELVADGRAGMLVERSPEAIATALGRLAADPDLRERLGAEGRRRALELGPDAYSEATLALYERLLSEPRR